MTLNTKRFVLPVLAVVMSLLVGCNTVAGFGTDVQKGGKAIERTARSA